MPKMTFIERDGTRREVDAPVGMSVLEVAHRNDIDIEGACEGSMACATCHVVVEPEWYGKLVPASEDEADMLDQMEGHTSELQSLMRISYAVFCLKKKKKTQTQTRNLQHVNNHT